jgi:hypothetical protein
MRGDTMKIIDAKRKDLPSFAWPGGYPVMYLARDGWRDDDTSKLDFNEHDRSENVCCAKCAADITDQPDLIIVGDFLHYEGPPQYCEYCNGFTDSAYGDPDAVEETK